MSDTPTRETARQIAEQAIADRDAYPWRYYRFERDDLLKWLNKHADQIATLTADLAQARQERDQKVGSSLADHYGHGWLAGDDAARALIRTLRGQLAAAEQARDEARTALEVGTVRGSLPDNEEGRPADLTVRMVGTPHEPSQQCCQSAARTALLKAAADAEERHTISDSNDDNPTWHEVADWLKAKELPNG
jgi:hypothetical protein